MSAFTTVELLIFATPFVCGAVCFGGLIWLATRRDPQPAPPSHQERAALMALHPSAGQISVMPGACRWCRGDGYAGEGFMRCDACHGTGLSDTAGHAA